LTNFVIVYACDVTDVPFDINHTLIIYHCASDWTKVMPNWSCSLKWLTVQIHRMYHIMFLICCLILHIMCIWLEESQDTFCSLMCGELPCLVFLE